VGTFLLALGRPCCVVKGPEHADDVAQGNIGDVPFGDGPHGLALEVEDGPPGAPASRAGGLRDLKDLAEVQVAMDALQRAGGYAVEAVQQCIQWFVVGPDGGTGFRPCLADALGYSGPDHLPGFAFG
jgi:hypothetical protein